MMSWKVRIAIIVVLFIGLIAIVNLIRKRNLELKYALTWLLLGVGLLIVVIVPGFVDTISDLMGIYNPMNMVFFIGFLFSIVVMFVLTMSASRNSNKVRKMAQKIALNEYRSNKNSERKIKNI